MNKLENVSIQAILVVLGLLAIYADLQREDSAIKNLIKTIQK